MNLCFQYQGHEKSRPPRCSDHAPLIPRIHARLHRDGTGLVDEGEEIFRPIDLARAMWKLLTYSPAHGDYPKRRRPARGRREAKGRQRCERGESRIRKKAWAGELSQQFLNDSHANGLRGPGPGRECKSTRAAGEGLKSAGAPSDRGWPCWARLGAATRRDVISRGTGQDQIGPRVILTTVIFHRAGGNMTIATESLRDTGEENTRPATGHENHLGKGTNAEL